MGLQKTGPIANLPSTHGFYIPQDFIWDGLISGPLRCSSGVPNGLSLRVPALAFQLLSSIGDGQWLRDVERFTGVKAFYKS